MKPIRIVASLVLCLAAIGIAANDCNPINAVTSASGKFKIKSGQAYATSAKITWWDYYDDGDQQAFKYGTTTAYGSTINLLPFTGQTDITTTIENLTPNTKYYLQVYRTFDGIEYKTNTTFTTFNGSSVKQPVPDAGLAVDLRDKIVEAYLPNGVCAASLRIPKGSSLMLLDDRLMSALNLRSGIYLFVVKDREQGAIISRVKKAVFR
jgi:hypothetical protein